MGLNTFLGDDSSPSDRLVIDTGGATGSSFLVVTNTTGSGALTLGHGILVVETLSGATTQVGASQFGDRVAPGPDRLVCRRRIAGNSLRRR